MQIHFDPESWAIFKPCPGYKGPLLMSSDTDALHLLHRSGQQTSFEDFPSATRGSRTIDLFLVPPWGKN